MTTYYNGLKVPDYHTDYYENITLTSSGIYEADLTFPTTTELQILVQSLSHSHLACGVANLAANRTTAFVFFKPMEGVAAGDPIITVTSLTQLTGHYFTIAYPVLRGE